MKFALSSFVCLLAVACANAALSAEQMKSLRAYAEECKKKTGATDADIAALKRKEIPQDRNSQCFVACMNKKLNFMTDDNKINVGRVKKTTAEFKLANPMRYDKGMKVLETCAAREDISVQDECVAAKKMMDCGHEEAEQAGLLSSRPKMFSR